MKSPVTFSVDNGDLVLSRPGSAASHFPAIFLRDNCPCSTCRHANGQRLFEIGDLAAETRICEIASSDGELRVRFSDGHQSPYSIDWLIDHDLSPAARKARSVALNYWGAEIAASLPQAHWGTLLEEPRVELAWLEDYLAYGFALLREVPVRAGMVAEVGDRLGYVRTTNYGRLFDVMSVPDPNNLAYTAVGLGVHSDNPYRDPTPGVQLLHCLEAGAPGGDTLLVDGFSAAEELRAESPTAFRILSSVPASFRFADRSADLRAKSTLISVDFDGKVTAVHFNNRSLDALDVPTEWVKPWYDAYRRFAEILRSPHRVVTLRLEPGDLIVMQNERALHGRSSFDPSFGRRHLQGCYVDKDALESRRRVLLRELSGAMEAAA